MNPWQKLTDKQLVEKIVANSNDKWLAQEIARRIEYKNRRIARLEAERVTK